MSRLVLDVVEGEISTTVRIATQIVNLPPRDQRVRITLGSTVLVGTIYGQYTSQGGRLFLHVLIDGAEWTGLTTISVDDGWEFETIEPIAEVAR